MTRNAVVSELNNLPHTSLGPMSTVTEFTMDVPLAIEGDELAPRNPSILQVRTAAKQRQLNLISSKKEKIELQIQKEKEIVEAREKAKAQTSPNTYGISVACPTVTAPLPSPGSGMVSCVG